MYAMKVMTRPVVTMLADATVWAAADMLLGARISAAPVVDGDGRMRSHSHHVADVMTRNVVAAEERTELKEIANLMQRHNIKHLPVEASRPADHRPRVVLVVPGSGSPLTSP